MSSTMIAPRSRPQPGLHPRATTNAGGWLLRLAAPDAPAIAQADHGTTYGELRCSVWAVQAASARLPEGARIGVLSRDGALFAAAYLGILRSGRIAVPLPAAGKRARLAEVVRGAHLSTAFADDASAGVLEALGLRRLLPVANARRMAPAVVADDDLAALMFTSGSTGSPKGVMVTHGNIRANTRDIIEAIGLVPTDRVLGVLPFHYCFGMSLLHTHLRVGGCVVLPRSCAFPEKMLDTLEEERCTGFAGVPSIYATLLDRSSFATRDKPSLRWLQQAGGALAPPRITALRAAAPRARLFVMYGQTEATARLSVLPPERLDDKLGSIGRGLGSTRLEVVGLDGRPVARGEVGEIVARGPNVTLGYLDEPEETARYFRDGALYTGDLGRIDEDGFVYVTGRRRSIIKAMGTRTSPEEVERVLEQHPAVAQAFVVGVEDPRAGEVVGALVVPVGEPPPVAQLRRHCDATLDRGKVPRVILFAAEPPLSDAGKVLRGEVRRLLAATLRAPLRRAC